MTKKKPSPQNRIWEKERRDRLNQTFDSLAKLLPDYEATTQLSKIEILQRTIEHVEKLQDKIKAFLEEQDELLKKHVDELEERLQTLIARNEDLAALLKKANITVPPCKVEAIAKRDSTEDQQTKPSDEVSKKTESKDQDVVQDKVVAECPVTSSAPANVTNSSKTLECRSIEIQPVEPAVVTTVINDTAVVAESTPAMSTVNIPSTCLVMANNQIVGTLQQTNGVNVTSALLPTPIMATGVLISNNGNVLQMPMVPSASSLLIVSNEDVRAKISMKKRRARTSADSKASPRKSKSSGKFTIKSIDVIPGRIVNGKIPIPALKRSPQPSKKERKQYRRKRSRKEVEGVKDHDGREAKKARVEEVGGSTEQPVEEVEDPSVQKVNEECNKAVEQKIVEETKPNDVPEPEDQANSLDMNLDQGDLSADIFANLQVPVGETDDHQGSLSPTAAYLMNFPLVAIGGKASGNHVDGSGDVEDGDCTELDKKASTQQASDTLLLDNFSSYFNSSGYGGLESILPPLPDIPSTSTATNVSTLYQSIDSMLEHKTSRTTSSSDCRYNSAPFTFTLTSSTTTVSTQSCYDYKQSSSSGYFYPTPVTSSKPIDEYCLLKPAIVSEFTFCLTSTTRSAPKTVQSQYTNSAIFASTITTPSYSTYGHQPRSSNKAASYSSNYIPDAAKTVAKTPKKYDLPEAEKPATSFTFSLTSTTKSVPKYTHSVMTTTSSTCVPQYPVSSAASNYSKVDDCLYKSVKSSHQPYKTSSKPKNNPYPAVTNYQPVTNTQSKYEVSWMASQDPKLPAASQDYNQLHPSLEYNNSSYQTNFDLSRKSDIFFAHPTTEDNLVSWSPNKLTNILNDTSSSYYPPTATSLPNLNGDLALNNLPNYQPPITTTKTSSQRKANDSGSTFLSVQQLVDQPRRNITKTYPSCSNYSTTQQKPLNNNYSAESLIAAPSAKNNTCSTYNTADNPLSFNFDYSTDYNKSYNYGCQQNYMPSFIDNSYGLPTLPPPTVTTTSASVTNYSNYSYSTDKKQSTTYYQSSSYQTTPADVPYYVPSSEKRTHQQTTTTSPTKSKKHHKQPVTNDFFPTILPPPPSIPDDPLSYTNFNFNAPKPSSQSTYAPASTNYSNNHSYQPTNVTTTTTPGSSLANFNLSTICPEINEKSGGANGGPATVAATVPPMRHAITGGAGW
uniref:(northern house mosquito) hypothetical protein n=1 Tax=Culex pipiens TaxID=7175 RepID=A0A8D8KCC5_CULPI